MELNCIIVDDEPLALNLLAEYVRRTPFLKLAAKCATGIEALDAFHKQKIDIAFLDIQMPELSGLELSKLISGTSIVFTTAFEQYAIEGYKVEAVDYLLKPFSYAEFLSAANKCAKRRELENRKQSQPADTHEQSIIVKSDYKQVIINIDDIDYIESTGDYITIHKKGENIQTLMSMKAIQNILPENIFVRVHRSFIVNINKITLIDRNRIVFGKEHIPISELYKENFDKLFGTILLK